MSALSEQFSLFPVSEFTDRERKPTMRQFLESDVQWHATDVEGWPDRVKEAGASVHSGSAEAARQRNGQHFYPVRPLNVSPETLTDRAANLAHAQFDHSRGVRVSDSVAQSGETMSKGPGNNWGVRQDDDGWVDPDSLVDGARQMRQGRSLQYENEGEDVGSKAYVSPPGSFLTAADVDMGLAKDWKPSREYFTRSEMDQNSIIPQRKPRPHGFVGSDPRLFEKVVGGGTGRWETLVAGEDVDPNSWRTEGGILKKDIREGAKFL